MNRTPALARFCRHAVLGLAAFGALQGTATAATEPLPVLLVIANQDFYYAEYAAVRSALQAQGLAVEVAAGDTRSATPQDRIGGVAVQPDRALAEVRTSDYSAVVFVGGWGASSYQYAFSGTYDHAAYRPQRQVTLQVNRLVNEFLAEEKRVAAICHGVTVLAWARVDGTSPLKGRVVVGPGGGTPGFRYGGSHYPNAEMPMRWQLELNGATQLTSASVGDPLSTTDDVWVDGRIITAENVAAASRFAEVIGQAVAGDRR
jgi:putative intracellular protease/amidase